MPRYDNNLIVIGAGSGGLVSALIASTVNAKVTLIEREKMGGDCLNTGCVPSKTLIRSASVNHLINNAQSFGLKNVSGEVDFAAVMQRVQQVIKTIEPHDSVERYTELGVNCISGDAVITGPHSVEVNGQQLTAKHIILASGARPFIPPIAGINDIPFLTSDNVWQLKQCPKRLLVLGGGPIGSELAQSFSRLGSQVTIMDMLDRLLPREDPEVSALLTAQFEREGITVATGALAQKVKKQADHYVLHARVGDRDQEFVFDQILVAVGRKANTENLGLEALGVSLNNNGTVATDHYMRTSCPSILACGDVAGPYQFTHMASHQAWYASVNALFGVLRKFKVNYQVVPWATFTDPEIATVGLNETDAKTQGIAIEVTRYEFSDFDRALADGAGHGFIKILTPPGKDKILGATIVGYHSAEILSQFVIAMTHGLGLKKLMATIHLYPAWSESAKFAASTWRKAHKPEGLLKLLRFFHQFRRI